MAQRVYRIGDITSTRDTTILDRVDSNGKVRKGGFKPGRKGLMPIVPATWWRWIKAGHAPAGFSLGPNVTVWDAAAVDAFIAKQAGGQQA